jgi:Domain of unknown function (DUF4331)
MRRKLAGRAALMIAAAGIATIGLVRWGSAADHRDSAALTADPAADIADVYVFRSPANTNNVVLAMDVSGLIPPSEAHTTTFDRNVLYQFKIDNNGDAVEDLVIQAYAAGGASDQVMRFRGPFAPDVSGQMAKVTGEVVAQVGVSQNERAIVRTGGGLTVFAGVRDDPFFFDLAQFQAILAGQATGFRSPGIDTFAGTNVLAIVVELPAAMLGGTNLRVWGTTSRM